MNTEEIIIDWVTYVPKSTELETTTKKVWFQIKNRFTGSIIYESETTCKEAVVEFCEKARESWTRADLTGADLTRADLTACLFYFGNGNRNFEALCKAIKTIKHPDGSFNSFQ